MENHRSHQRVVVADPIRAAKVDRIKAQWQHVSPPSLYSLCITCLCANVDRVCLVKSKNKKLDGYALAPQLSRLPLNVCDSLLSAYAQHYENELNRREKREYFNIRKKRQLQQQQQNKGSGEIMMIDEDAKEPPEEKDKPLVTYHELLMALGTAGTGVTRIEYRQCGAVANSVISQRLFVQRAPSDPVVTLRAQQPAHLTDSDLARLLQHQQFVVDYVDVCPHVLSNRSVDLLNKRAPHLRFLRFQNCCNWQRDGIGGGDDVALHAYNLNHDAAARAFLARLAAFNTESNADHMGDNFEDEEEEDDSDNEAAEEMRDNIVDALMNDDNEDQDAEDEQQQQQQQSSYDAEFFDQQQQDLDEDADLDDVDDNDNDDDDEENSQRRRNERRRMLLERTLGFHHQHHRHNIASDLSSCKLFQVSPPASSSKSKKQPALPSATSKQPVIPPLPHPPPPSQPQIMEEDNDDDDDDDDDTASSILSWVARRAAAIDAADSASGAAAAAGDSSSVKGLRRRRRRRRHHRRHHHHKKNRRQNDTASTAAAAAATSASRRRRHQHQRPTTVSITDSDRISAISSSPVSTSIFEQIRQKAEAILTESKFIDKVSMSSTESPYFPNRLAALASTKEEDEGDSVTDSDDDDESGSTCSSSLDDDDDVSFSGNFSSNDTDDSNCSTCANDDDDDDGELSYSSESATEPKHHHHHHHHQQQKQQQQQKKPGDIQRSATTTVAASPISGVLQAIASKISFGKLKNTSQQPTPTTTQQQPQSSLTIGELVGHPSITEVIESMASTGENTLAMSKNEQQQQQKAASARFRRSKSATTASKMLADGGGAAAGYLSDSSASCLSFESFNAAVAAAVAANNSNASPGAFRKKRLKEDEQTTDNSSTQQQQQQQQRSASPSFASFADALSMVSDAEQHLLLQQQQQQDVEMEEQEQQQKSPSPPQQQQQQQASNNLFSVLRLWMTKRVDSLTTNQQQQQQQPTTSSTLTSIDQAASATSTKKHRRHRRHRHHHHHHHRHNKSSKLPVLSPPASTAADDERHASMLKTLQQHDSSSSSSASFTSLVDIIALENAMRQRKAATAASTAATTAATTSSSEQPHTDLMEQQQQQQQQQQENSSLVTNDKRRQLKKQLKSLKKLAMAVPHSSSSIITTAADDSSRALAAAPSGPAHQDHFAAATTSSKLLAKKPTSTAPSMSRLSAAQQPAPPPPPQPPVKLIELAHLQQLSLRNLGSSGILSNVMLNTLLRNLPTLRFLDISNCCTGQLGPSAASRPPAKYSKLSSSSLASDFNGLDGLLALAPSLTHLIMADLNVDDVVDNLRFLLRMRSLRHLDVSNCREKVPVNAYKNASLVLAKLVYHLRALRSLDISGTNLSGPTIFKEADEADYIKKRLYEDLALDGGEQMMDTDDEHFTPLGNCNIVGLMFLRNEERMLDFLGCFSCDKAVTLRSSPSTAEPNAAALTLPAKRVACEDGEACLYVSLETYMSCEHHPLFLLDALNHFFELYRDDHIEDKLLGGHLIMQTMEANVSNSRIQISGSASLFYVLKYSKEDNVPLPYFYLRRLIQTVINAMEIHIDENAMRRNCVLIMCRLNLPDDVLFVSDRLIKILLKIFDDYIEERNKSFLSGSPNTAANDHRPEHFVLRTAMHLLNILACSVHGTDKSEVGKLAIPVAMDLIRTKVQCSEADDVLEVTWSFLWNITDETPENCRIFLDQCDGLRAFMDCIKFKKAEITRNMMGLLGNVAEVSTLRNRLCKNDLIATFRQLLFDSTDGIEIPYNSAGVLVHIMSDGQEAWKAALSAEAAAAATAAATTASTNDNNNNSNNNGELTTTTTSSISATAASDIAIQNRQSVIQDIETAIDKWDLNLERNINYRSFEPIFRLASQFSEPVCQRWSTWALANLTTVYPDIYCPLFERENGYELLERMLASGDALNDAVKNFVRIVLANVENNRIKQQRAAALAPTSSAS